MPASTFAFYAPIGTDTTERARLRDEMADRIVATIAARAPNFPELIERQINYPAYTYELMFGCTGGDFTHGLLQPEFMGPFRPGSPGLARQPYPRRGPLPVWCRLSRRPGDHLHPRVQLRLRGPRRSRGALDLASVPHPLDRRSSPTARPADPGPGVGPGLRTGGPRAGGLRE